MRQAGGPVTARQVGETLGVDVSVKSKLEPLRGKLIRLTDRGWLRKQPDGRFTPACDLLQHDGPVTTEPSAAWTTTSSTP